MISMPSNVAAALASANYRTAILINLPGTGFKVTDNHKELTYNGVTYKPDDQALLGASSVQRTNALSSSPYQIKFAGADRTATRSTSTTHTLAKTLLSIWLFSMTSTRY